MGMYSSFDYEDIKVVDWKGLKAYLEIIQTLDWATNHQINSWRI